MFGFTIECDDPVCSAEERLLIRLVDELHDTSAISDGLWRELAAAFGVLRERLQAREPFVAPLPSA